MGEAFRYGVTGLVVVGALTWLVRDEGRAIRSARIAGPLALIGIALWLILVFFYAPVERVQGIVQKIFYVHVPCAPVAYLGFVMTAVGGIGFLRTRDQHWDRVSVASAEVGVLFCTLILITGPIWAKPVWGHWWVWDLRLTSTLVLWFIYAAYLFLRSLTAGSDAARTFASLYGILGTAAIPFVFFAVDLAQGSTLHPSNPAREGLPTSMLIPLLVGFVSFALVFWYLFARRLEIAQLEFTRPEVDPG
ncbi:MAG: cytochrome c biogenesis protein CcsA [Myxococcota bacterium]|nr:cytochrome c biogenesis protein CcsA [Myxococcota bacterium]